MRTFLFFLLLNGSALAQAPTPPAATAPTLRVQVVVGTSQKRIGDSYKKEMSINPKATVEGANRLGTIPALNATMLIITMDTKAKYVRGKDAYTVHTAQTLPLAEAPNGNLRTLDFADSRLVFDSYRDASNLGGAVYKYYVFGLTDPATNKIVDFQTNDADLAAFCKTHPEKPEAMLKVKKGAKYPADFK